MPGGYAWFELGWTATGITIDFQQAEASRRRAVAFVGEAAAAYGADPARIYLVGFSQGAMVAAGVALTEPGAGGRHGADERAGARADRGRSSPRPSGSPASRSWSSTGAPTRCCRSRTAAPAARSCSGCRSI
ncbi:MAG: hypothetical protein IPO81_04260 [Kouleothrix sp.]|nr:hypothetical protein [Kouleothrix sp.]